MFKPILVLVISVGLVLSVNWNNRARVPDHTGFFSRLVQEMIYDLEKFEWCNLKIDQYSQTLNERLYQWHVQGTVTYTNGFLVSVQAMDITNMQQTVATRSVGGVDTVFTTVRGVLSLQDVTVGFDVIVDLVDDEQQRYSGVYTHTRIVYQLEVTKNMVTGEVTSSPSMTSLSSGAGLRMIYMPANNVTEVLSRRYMPNNNQDSAAGWARNIFGPMLVDIATNRVPFPELCFNNCPP